MPCQPLSVNELLCLDTQVPPPSQTEHKQAVISDFFLCSCRLHDAACARLQRRRCSGIFLFITLPLSKLQLFGIFVDTFVSLLAKPACTPTYQLLEQAVTTAMVGVFSLFPSCTPCKALELLGDM